jgi:response regulator RpfG family c-di-GMP phosphodiesterase
MYCSSEQKQYSRTKGVSMATIVLIDDNVQIHDLAARFLRNHTLYAAATLAKAQLVLDQVVYDLVICDGTVERDGDGAALGKRLQDEGSNVIVYSTHPYEGMYSVYKSGNLVLLRGHVERKLADPSVRGYFDFK